MDVFEAIKSRRSIRAFQEKEIPEEFIEKILDSARWAPSAGNTQPWEFIIV
ncbi:MAG: nitroreductase family protein, partial [Nitrososphaerota archaeon]